MLSLTRFNTILPDQKKINGFSFDVYFISVFALLLSRLPLRSAVPENPVYGFAGGQDRSVGRKS